MFPKKIEQLLGLNERVAGYYQPQIELPNRNTSKRVPLYLLPNHPNCRSSTSKKYENIREAPRGYKNVSKLTTFVKYPFFTQNQITDSTVYSSVFQFDSIFSLGPTPALLGVINVENSSNFCGAPWGISGG